MNFAIITHATHIRDEINYFTYAPYVREMNIWIKYAKKVIIVAPESNLKKSPIDLKYEHQNIQFVAVSAFDVLNLKGIFSTVFKIPSVCWKMYSAMRKADHIHLRCPGNMGLLGCLVQILFPNTIKTAKYAGNWDPKSKQPLSYKLQKWILSNTFITRNMKVLVYGQWEGTTKNILPFFTATYYEVEKSPIISKDFKKEFRFIFVGTLVAGKNPLYAIRLIEMLHKEGYNVALDLYGEGIERNKLEKYIVQQKVENIISFKGNQTQEILKKAYQRSHFVVLPSESEGWPKALAEGMFWGCVPLATKVSCVPYILDYGNRGVVLAINLENDFSQMKVLLQNQTDYKSKSEKASFWSRKYTLDVFEKEIKKLLLR
jgi:glycosyltransferase involved in cell wall biosynthesis